MPEETILDELHRVREKMMQEFDNDLGKLVAYLQKQEKRHAALLVDPGGRKQKKGRPGRP
ncbi:MAG: hypothetical protein GX442_11675 [Candidatus Riflebacteria bacterium]|nr:hypothetical protein [Candidatus Riflebacteria bacterium]